jgi:hypothetical protein
MGTAPWMAPRSVVAPAADRMELLDARATLIGSSSTAAVLVAFQQENLVITMTDVLVTSVSTSVSAEGDATVEGVALAFAKVDLEYKPQKPDGSLDVGIHFKFDLKANKEG